MADRGEPPSSSGPSDESMVRGELLFQAIESTFSDPHLAQLRAETLVTLLRDLAVFSALDDRQLREVAELAKVARVSSGQVIIHEGTSSEAVYVLLTGAVTVSEGGTVRERLGRGDEFGGVGVRTHQARTGTVTAERDLWLMRLPADALQTLIARDPLIAESLFTQPDGE